MKTAELSHFNAIPFPQVSLNKFIHTGWNRGDACFFFKVPRKDPHCKPKTEKCPVNALKFGPNWLWLLRVNIDLRLWITAAFSKRE